MYHPNIIQINEIYIQPEKLFMITDLYTGQQLLDEIISHNKFSESIAAYITRQIISALYYCHSNSVMHSCITPENIVFSKPKLESKIKLIDFGFPFIMQKSGKLKNVKGNIIYFAPETISGSYTFKSDIWSVGIITYIMLTGKSPY